MIENQLFALRDVCYEYDWNRQKVPVLKGVNLDLQKGSFTCLIGPSGVGKTTLLNLMGLIEKPSAGEIILDGISTSALKESELERHRLHHLGFIFQAFYLIPTLTVLENASYFLESLGKTTAQGKQIALEVLDILGIVEQRNKKPHEISGGQRQRVAIARALVKRPKVILADEPTANLDTETASKIISAFQEIQKSNGTSFVFATHDSHLLSYAKDVVSLKAGKVISTQEIGVPK
jgi:ABC-type lipoprotein export system ATPase subunit